MATNSTGGVLSSISLKKFYRIRFSDILLSHKNRIKLEITIVTLTALSVLVFISIIRSHYLMLLLIVELFILLLINTISLFNIRKIQFPSIIILILITVCIGGYSISILIAFSRNSGKDYASEL
jgi:hypothetical protein